MIKTFDEFEHDSDYLAIQNKLKEFYNISVPLAKIKKILLENRHLTDEKKKIECIRKSISKNVSPYYHNDITKKDDFYYKAFFDTTDDAKNSNNNI